MGKFAPVGPARIYAEMADSFDEHGYQPERVLLLAHDVAANAEEYRKAFDQEYYEDTFIIMDNSVIELGNSVDVAMVKAAVDAVDADAVVLPDIINDSRASTSATHVAWSNWQRVFPDQEKMVLVQGATLADWLWSCEVLADLSPEWVGIPRITEHYIGNNEKVHRDELAKMAKAIFTNNPQIHLFGFSDYVAWDLMSAACPWVDSIDSAVPLRLQTNNILTEQAGKRGHWWDSAVYHNDMAARCQIVDDYIERFASVIER